MIGLLIVTHGHLSEALLESASMLVADTESVRTVSFFPGQGVEDLEAAVRAAADELAGSEGILALVDIPGGSPARVVGSLTVERADLELVTGVNLAMLADVLMARRGSTLSALVEVALRAGRDSITDLASAIRAQAAIGGDAEND